LPDNVLDADQNRHQRSNAGFVQNFVTDHGAPFFTGSGSRRWSNRWTFTHSVAHFAKSERGRRAIALPTTSSVQRSFIGGTEGSRVCERSVPDGVFTGTRQKRSAGRPRLPVSGPGVRIRFPPALSQERGDSDKCSPRTASFKYVTNRAIGSCCSNSSPFLNTTYSAGDCGRRVAAPFKSA
jgi:hypothetical protein